MRPQAAAMKALLDKPGLQIMPGCGDVMGARLIKEAGFRTGFAFGQHLSDVSRYARHGPADLFRKWPMRSRPSSPPPRRGPARGALGSRGLKGW
jgi:hypothetical protein